MTHIKYSITINGKQNTLLYSHWSKNGYHYRNESDTEEHIFEKPLADYPAFRPIQKNSKTYIILSKP